MVSVGKEGPDEDATGPADAGEDPPWVTVLMPVYNGERYVRSAIESVLAQTHQRFEFLIMDDGSTDGTPDILAEYAAIDPRIRVERHANMDQPATLNRGLSLARHDWVAIIDHDDIWLPERIERQLDAVRREPDAKVIGCWAKEINARGRVLRHRTLGPTTCAEFHALRATGQRVPLVHPSVLMHRPSILALGGYDPLFGSAADTELWTRVAAAHAIVVVPEPLVLYRIHGGSMSFRRMFEQREMLRLIMERDRARVRGQAPLVTLEQFRAARRPWSVRWWAELQQDLFWFFRSFYLLAAAQGWRLAAAGLALCAGAVAPGNAVRLVRRLLHARAARATPPTNAPPPATPPTHRPRPFPPGQEGRRSGTSISGGAGLAPRPPGVLTHEPTKQAAIEANAS